jgi:hypothetical protein
MGVPPCRTGGHSESPSLAIRLSAASAFLFSVLHLEDRSGVRSQQLPAEACHILRNRSPWCLMDSTYVAEVQSITHSIRYLRRLSDIGSVVPPLTRSETQAVPQHGFLGTST